MLSLFLHFESCVPVEHACHVTMACNKFMQRIVGEEGGTIKEADENAAELQKHTHGVTSGTRFCFDQHYLQWALCPHRLFGLKNHADPLARLAIVLSALIHDV